MGTNMGQVHQGARRRISWPRRGTMRNRLRLIAWNLLLGALGLAAVAAVSEGYLRATKPFMHRAHVNVNVPGVGALRKPGSAIRYTNALDVWTTTRVNRWGFADREPLPSTIAENGCHVAVIGDSFVEALQVPIADKIHVQLEQLAASERPRLRVTTSAFGRSGTGQVAQLPYYDKFASTLKPKLIVLVFVHNDFMDNATVQTRQMSLEREADGTLRLHPPDPSWKPKPFHSPSGSYLAQWLKKKHIALLKPHRPPVPEDFLCLDCTRFALRQFAIRAQRDGAAVVILSEHRIRGPRAELLARLAGDLPVLSLADYLAARKLTDQDITWDHDSHWTPAGHRLAARALLDYLQTNDSICSAKVAAA